MCEILLSFLRDEVITDVQHTIQILFDVTPYRMVNSSQQSKILLQRERFFLDCLTLKIVVLRSLEMLANPLLSRISVTQHA